MSTVPRHLLRLRYAQAAEDYLRSLKPENFMEAAAQGTQRKITLESFDLIHAARPAVQAFNELLVQYPYGRWKEIRQVVPDNFAIICEDQIDPGGSYDVVFQPVPPFLVLEYVSKYNKRKDYEKNLRRYERELKTPFYLVFYPDNQELTVFQLRGRKYSSVKPNQNDRYPIPDLDLEVALLDGWVRYWFRRDLLPLPADLQHELVRTRQELAKEKRRADQEKRRADELQSQIEHDRQTRLEIERELAQLRAQLAAQPRRPRNGG
jgi:Uma2 family endonuclease